MSILRFATCVFLAASVSHPLAAQSLADTAPPAGSSSATEQERRFRMFEEQMSGVKFVGRFTVLGREDGPLAEEEYTIKSVKKMPQGDYWLFTARIKYGKQDVTLPLPLEVKWAADTPIITLSELTIPVLGTFSSRVVIYNKKYAGTWTHGKVGGHLFGTIQKADAETPADAPR